MYGHGEEGVGQGAGVVKDLGCLEASAVKTIFTIAGDLTLLDDAEKKTIENIW